MNKLLFKSMFLPVIIVILLAGCKKDEAGPKGTLKLGITDTRSSLTKADMGILDASKLTKFEITISSLEVKTSDGVSFIALDQPTAIDLRDYQGTVKDLASAEIPIGHYAGLIISFSGISITYDGNNYSSALGGATSLTLGDFPGLTLTPADGVPVLFSSELILNLNFDFDLTEERSNRNLNIGIDAVASCGEVEIPCTLCGGAQLFASLRNFFQLNIYFEEGIQQIRHSPPLGIELSSGTTAEYYGIHTFVDFNGIGGTINSHTSQHIYRGADGFLIIAAEDMATNSSALTPGVINATGETDVRADEVFDFAAIEANLSEQGYNLVPGNKYYFSLKKTWNITSGNTIYEITRVCEPIPVIWPQLVN